MSLNVLGFQDIAGHFVEAAVHAFTGAKCCRVHAK
jgi:hypothetical protein